MNNPHKNLGDFSEFLASVFDWADIDPYQDFPRFSYAASSLTAKLPSELIELLESLKAGDNKSGYLLIKGVPIGSPPQTPLNSRQPKYKCRYESELTIYSISRALGQVFCYPEQSDGEIVHNICPVPGRENLKVGENSTSMLAFHNDGAAHKVTPDFIALLCLREGQNTTSTLITNINQIIPKLPREYLSTLCQDRFIISDDLELSLKKTEFEKTSILRIDNGRLKKVVIDFDSLSIADPEDFTAKNALCTLKEMIADYATPIYLKAGDLIVIDNRIAVHARRSFQAKFDGTDRWIQSTYVKSGLTRKEIERIKLSPSCIVKLAE